MFFSPNETSEYHSKSIDQLVAEVGIPFEQTAQFKELMGNCKWFGEAHEFLWLLDSSSTTKPVQPVVLGLSHVEDSTESFGLAMEGVYWLAASIQLKVPIDHPNHSQKFRV